jgi:hypothetical protein
MLRLATLALALLPALASAQPKAGAAVEGQLFDAGGAALAVNKAAGLDAEARGMLETLVAANGFKYYGAIAFSPDEGLVSESLQGAFNYHDINAAAAAALSACGKAKKPASAGCILAAQILPRGYSPRGFQLSQDATAAFAGYRKAGQGGALAISPVSGAYGVARGAAAGPEALAACNAKAPRRDCVLAVRD